jgi:hypothetical protein
VTLLSGSLNKEIREPISYHLSKICIIGVYNWSLIFFLFFLPSGIRLSFRVLFLRHTDNPASSFHPRRQCRQYDGVLLIPRKLRDAINTAGITFALPDSYRHRIISAVPPKLPFRTSDLAGSSHYPARIYSASVSPPEEFNLS